MVVSSTSSPSIHHGNSLLPIPQEVQLLLMTLLMTIRSWTCHSIKSRLMASYLYGSLTLNTDLHLTCLKRTATRWSMKLPGSSKQSMVRLPKVTDTTCSTPKRLALLESKDTLRVKLGSTYSATLFSVSVEASLRSLKKSMRLLKLLFPTATIQKSLEEGTIYTMVGLLLEMRSDSL